MFDRLFPPPLNQRWLTILLQHNAQGYSLFIVLVGDIYIIILSPLRFPLSTSFHEIELKYFDRGSPFTVALSGTCSTRIRVLYTCD